MKSKPSFFQRGVTLFEVLLVLFVAAFIAVAVAAIYNKVMTTVKTNNLISDVQQIASGIHSLYASTGDYTGLTNTIVINAGIAPPEMVSGTNAITPFAATTGAWTVTPAAGTPSTSFYITVTNIPSSACVSLGSGGLGGGALSVAGSVGGSAYTTPGDVASGTCAGANPKIVLQYN